MPDPFDVVVIGGGHNGLVAAGLLAKRGARVVVLERATTVGGAAITEQPWGPRYKMTSLSYVVSLMPPTIVARARARAPRLPRLSAARVLRTAPRRPLLQLPTTATSDRAVLADATPTRTSGGMRGSVGLADVLGPLLTAIPPRLGSLRPGDLVDQGAARVEVAPAGVPGVARRHAAVHVEHRRPARRLVRVAADAGRALGQRRHRHVGRAAFARHRVRDGAPQDRRRRRRRARHVGLSRGRHGRRDATRCAARRSRSARRSAPTRRSRASTCTTVASRGVVLESGEELRADVVIAATHPKITFLDQIDRGRASRRLRRRDRALEDRAAARSRSTSRSIGCPSSAPSPASIPKCTAARSCWRSRSTTSRARSRTRSAGRAARLPVRRHLHPVRVRRLARTRRPPRRVDVHAVGAARWAIEARCDELDAYADRVIARVEAGRARVHAIDPAPAGDRAVRDGARVRPRRRQHLPRRAVAGQLFHMRPAPGYADFRTPIAGLYQASSATHGGGGVTGIPGMNVAAQIVHDRRRARWRRA